MADMTERQLIAKLQTSMQGRPAELQERAKKMLIASHRQQQHLLHTKGKSFDEVLVFIEENMALARLVGGDECVREYLRGTGEGLAKIIGEDGADELRIKLNELHELMKQQGS
jgi:ATP-dependent protease ClpP protease subunit